ncbi:MAG: hypothetical protein PHF86_07375 [Candidatus Nanoarchaeia archaeon]|nr:hypothetical protein [Candidatus Nanoarchaeia archaeon]
MKTNKKITKIINSILKESVEKLVPAEIKITLEPRSLEGFQETVRQVPGFGGFVDDNPIMTLNVLINPKITNERKFRDDLSKKNLKTVRVDVMRT